MLARSIPCCRVVAGGQINEDTVPRAVREYLETLDDAAFVAASEGRLTVGDPIFA